MGYNVLSGSVSVVNVIQSGSFSGDGSGLENVIQFETQNASATRIPFYKTISGDLGLNAHTGFFFTNADSALTVPNLTSSVGFRLLSPTSGAIAGRGSFLGVDPDGRLVVTSSGISYSRTPVSGNFTATINDTILGVSATASLQITLPSAAGYLNGQYFVIKDEAGNANIYNITINYFIINRTYCITLC